MYLGERSVGRIIVIGRVLESYKAINQRGMPIINIRLSDETAYSRFYFFYSEELWTTLCKKNTYLKMIVNVKSGGLPYKPEIKLMGVGVVEVNDYNEITNHNLSCMERV